MLIYTACVRVQPLPPHTLHHSSAIRLHTSSFLQLFIHHTYGHTFPITQKASEPKVHEVSRYSRIFRMIEPSHFYFSSCLVHRYVIAAYVPYAAILSRLIDTDSSSYTVPSLPEVFQTSPPSQPSSSPHSSASYYDEASYNRGLFLYHHISKDSVCCSQ